MRIRNLHTFESLGLRDYRLLWLGQLSTAMGLSCFLLVAGIRIAAPGIWHLKPDLLKPPEAKTAGQNKT